MKIMVVAPHPDDELIGPGGSVINHVRQGHEVCVVYMTSGDAGGRANSKEELAAIREGEARNGLNHLGISDLTFLKYPDGYVTYGQTPLIRLMDIIKAKRPDIVYMPHAADDHQDHMATHRIAREAVARSRGYWFQESGGDPWNVGTVLCYEVWTPLPEFNYVEDITESIDLKVRALQEHRSQLADLPYNDAVRGLNRYRGAMTGEGTYCECFQVLKVTRLW